MCLRRKLTHFVVVTLVGIALQDSVASEPTARDSVVVAAIRAELARVRGQIQDARLVRRVTEIRPKSSRKTDQVAFIKGAQLRMEIRDEGTEGKMKAMVIHDGTDGWLFIPVPLVGKRRLDPADFLLSPMRWMPWALVNDGARIIGEEVVNGRDCWILQLARPAGYARADIWVDKKDYTSIKGRATDYDEVTHEWIHSEFHELISGFRIPYRTETEKNGELVSVAEVQAIELNRGLDDELFDLRKAKLK